MSWRVSVRWAVGVITASLATVVCSAATATAAITPAVTLDQSAGTAAGSTAALGMALTFAPTGSDSPKDLTLTLPPGLLADAAIDGGSCLHSHTASAPCQVGSGSASAAPVIAGIPTVPVSVPLRFYLVAPPQPGDLAGLLIQATFLGMTSQLGNPGAVTVRPSSDPDGVGLDIAFAGVPDTFAVLGPLATPISVRELTTTFDGLRLPTRCPATPASVTVTADSYAQPATPHSASTPLQVTGCSALPYTPAFHVAVTKDVADTGVQIISDVTQPARPPQATNRSVALTLPASVLSPNVAAVLGGGILCANPASGTCKPIGTASSASPLYPTPLVGKDYLTGSLAAPAIAIVFPPPFALTLHGTVDLASSTTTFTGVPDIPLTDLQVALSGGPDAVFATTCATRSGTATSTLTTQNGDRTAVVSSPFTVSGCPAPGGSPPPPGTTTPPSGTTQPPLAGARPHLGAAGFSGLAKGHPTVRFTLTAAKGSPRLRSITIALPPGLRFVEHRRNGRLHITAVTVTGATPASLVVRHGRLVITLRRPVSRVSVTLHPAALGESTQLRTAVRRHRVRRLRLSIVAIDARGRHTTLSQLVRVSS